jgi:hypothetical protein
MQLLSLKFSGLSLLFLGHFQNPLSANITAIAGTPAFALKYIVYKTA